MKNNQKFPNIILFVKLFAFAFMIVLYFFFDSLLLAGCTYLVLGLAGIANIYMVYRGVMLSEFQQATNLIASAVFNVVAFGLIVISGKMGVVLLLILFALEMTKTMYSYMIVSNNYDEYKSKKRCILLDSLIWFGILTLFFAKSNQLVNFVFGMLVVLYVTEIILQVILNYNLPKNKETKCQEQTLENGVNKDEEKNIVE